MESVILGYGIKINKGSIYDIYMDFVNQLELSPRFRYIEIKNDKSGRYSYRNQALEYERKLISSSRYISKFLGFPIKEKSISFAKIPFEILRYRMMNLHKPDFSEFIGTLQYILNKNGYNLYGNIYGYNDNNDDNNDDNDNNDNDNNDNNNINYNQKNNNIMFLVIKNKDISLDSYNIVKNVNINDILIDEKESADLSGIAKLLTDKYIEPNLKIYGF